MHSGYADRQEVAAIAAGWETVLHAANDQDGRLRLGEVGELLST
ncbi:hypothetical protein ABZ297_18745 [Nonomuraea sp. NPDC005983]